MRGQGLLIFLLLGMIPLAILMIQTKWGVLFGIGLAVVAGIGLWVTNRGFAFVEVAAFLIHFDGFGFGPLRMGRFVAGAAILLVLYKLLVENWRPPAIPARHWLPPLALMTWAVFSGAWSHDVGGFIFFLGFLGLGLAFFATTAFLLDSYEKVARYLRAYWYGGLWGSLAGVWALVIGTRSVGFGADPNFFGLLAASMIPLTVYYRRQAQTTREKWFYTFVVLFVFAGAAGAGSRSGIIGASVAIVGTMVTRPGLSGLRRARVGVGAIALAAVAFIVMFFANPANLQRGFSDRGAGRIDFWTVTVDLVKDNPVVGYGGGQLSSEITPKLATTPGVQGVSDSRESVSSHNTWLDIAGDLGLIGLGIFVSLVLIAMWGFLRPRWSATKDISTTLFVMMLPVLTSSNFLPLLNNKLSWSLLGISAALQTPSWGARYSGYFEPPGGQTQLEAEWRETHLARWDLRVSRRFRIYVLFGALIGGLLFGAVISSTPTKYKAYSDVVVPSLDSPSGQTRVIIPMQRVQMLNTLVISDAYAAELKELSGLQLGIREIRDRLTAVRPGAGAVLRIAYVDVDSDRVDLAAPHLTAALDAVVERGKSVNQEVLSEELRPMYPGEQRYYDGPLFLPISSEPAFVESPPRTVWVTLMGMISGALLALVFVLLQQRRPRVNNDDNFRTAVGMNLWTHVGRMGRSYSASPEQYAHVALTAFENAGSGDRRPSRMLLASPHSGRTTRGVAMGVAASLAESGNKVVLVDGQVERPWLSARLGGLRGPGLAELSTGEADLHDSLRRVSKWRLPSSVRKTLRGGGDNLRFISSGRTLRKKDPTVDAVVLDALSDDVIVVLVSPPLLGTVPAAPSLKWADVVLYCLEEGGTVTFEAEDAALSVRTFSEAPAGVILADV